MLEGQHYQNAYICADMDAAIGQFRRRGLTRDVSPFEVEQPVDAPDGSTAVNHVKLAFIWIGDLQYELIQPISDPLGVYANYTSNGGLMHFHHICMRVPDWDDFLVRARQQDLPIAMKRDMGEGRLKFLYLDARPVFGHYLEYTCMSDAQWDQMRAL